MINQHRILLSTRCFPPLETQAIALDLGFDGIEIVMPSRLKPNNLPINYRGVTHAPVIHAPIDLYDSSRFGRALRDALKLAGSLQAKLVTIHPPSREFNLGGQDNVEQGCRLMKQLQEERGDIVIASEVQAVATNRQQQLQAGYESPSAWCEDIKAKGLAATLDTTHVASWGEDPAAYVNRLGSSLVHLHCSDYDPATRTQHLFPGQGQIDWSAFFGALRDNDLGNVSITLEPSGKYDFRQPEYRQQLQQSLAFVQEGLAN